jgi:polyisoprenoid-binding protein YceI
MTTAVHPFSGTYTADPDHSSFHAQLRHMGVGSFRTGFEDVRARLEATSAGLRLTGSTRVDSVTIKRPADFRAHVVEGEDFFDAGNHPEISFASTRIELAADGTIAVDGELTMRGVTSPVSATGVYVAPVEDLYGGVRAAIDLTAEIDRRDWGMSFQAQLPRGGDVLSWTVALSIHLELVADREP